jgi:hypothetical protein
VQAFRLIGKHKMETRNHGMAIHELDLFLKRQAAQQVCDTRIVIEFRIAKRIIRLRAHFERHESKY